MVTCSAAVSPAHLRGVLLSAMSRLAAVCGGSRGIGKAVSRLLAEKGCRLAVLSRNEDVARATVASLHGGMELCTDTHKHACFSRQHVYLISGGM